MASIGGFELETVVGRGASASVWRAHTRGGVAIALKVLDEAVDDAHGAGAFRRELAAVAGLDHPSIARVLDHGVVGAAEASVARGLRAGAPYIAMELAHGSLRERGATLGWPEVHAALVALLAALAHAHARGILHRDVKPGNLLVDGSRSPFLLADFGLARVRESQWLAEPGQAERSLGPMIGTPSYMAPEQCEGHSADHGPWTDLYAVGGLAWTLVCGRPPFGSGLTAIHGHVYAPIPPLRPRFAVPAGFEAWLRRLLAKRPSERYARACDAARDLDRCRDGGSAAIPRDGPRTPPSTPATTDAGGGLRLLGLRELPFIGRDDARARLWRDLRDVDAGLGPRAWLIEGPSGYGKSRLARWIAESAHEQLGAEVLTATHSADPGPRDGLAPMVDEHLRCAGLSREDAVARVAAHLGVGDADPVAVTLAELCVGRRAGQMPVARAIAAWVAGIGAARPVVVWLDDVQWGAAAIRLMRTLLGGRASGGAARVLIVATVQREASAERPAERAELERLAGPVHVERLEPLGEDEHQALVQSVVALEPALARRLAARTAGNPLFAVHLVKDWAERGWLTEGRDGYGLRAGADGAEPPLPASLAATWVARIDRLLAGLSEGASDGLELAAALGQTVDVGEWRTVAGEAATEALLVALIEAGLAASTPSTFAFAHGMVREAILARASAGERLAAHHRRCAQGLAARAVGDATTPSLWARVGRHRIAAGELADAVVPLSEAAMHAADQGAIELATGVADELASVLTRMGVPSEDPRWAEVSITRSAVALLAADVAAARAAARDAFPAATSARPERHVRALQLLGEVEHRFGRPADAVAWYDRAAVVAEAHGRPVLRNAIELSRLRMLLEQGPATPDVQARLVALLATDAVDRGNVLVSLGRVHLDLGELDTAWAYTDAAMVEFRAAHRAEGIAGGLTLFGEIARFRRAWADAERFNLEARALFERLGSRTNLDILDLNLVQIAHEAGDVGEAERRLARIVDGHLDDGLGSLVHGIALLFHAAAPDPAPFAHHVDEARAAWVRTGRWWSDAVLAGTRAAQMAEQAGYADRAAAARALVAAWRD